MAMNQQTAQLILELVDNASASLKNSQKQVTKLKKEIDSVNKSSTKAEKGSERLGTSFNKTGKQAQSLSSRFKTVGKAAQRLFFIYETGVRILRAAKQFFVDPFVEAGKAASDFAGKLAEINTLFDKGVRNSAERVAFLGEAIKNVSINMGQDLLKTADSAYNAVSAGATDAATAQKLLENATKLSVAGLVETDVAMKALTTVSNSFGRSLGSSEKVSDLLFTTVQKGVTTMGELAPKIGRVSGVAAASGMSMEAMFAVLAAGTKITGNTSRAVTGLGSAINLLLKPGKDAEETLALVNSRLKGYQIDIGASAVQNGNMISTLQAMAKAFKEGKLGADELAKIIPNQRAQAVVLGIVKEGAQEVADIYKKMSDEGIVAGATQLALEKRMKTSAFQTQRFKSAMQGARTALGNFFERSGLTKGFLKGMADELQNVIRAFTFSNEGTVDQTANFEKLGRMVARTAAMIVIAVKAVVKAVIEVVNTITTLADVLTNLFISFGPMLSNIGLSVMKSFRALQADLAGIPGALGERVRSFFGLEGTAEDYRKQASGLQFEISKNNERIKMLFGDMKDALAKQAIGIAEVFTKPIEELTMLMAGDLAKIETVTNKSLGLDKKTTTRTPPPPPKVTYELKTKEAKEAAAFFAEIFAGQQADFQQALFDAGTRFAVDPVTRGLISDVYNLFPDLPLEGLRQASEQSFEMPLPGLPLEGIQASVDAFQHLAQFASDGANEAQFASNALAAAFRKMAPEPSTVQGLEALEKKIDAIVSIILKLSKEDLNKVLAGGAEGAEAIVRKQLENATEAAKIRDKLAADIEKRNLARREKQDKRDQKREKKANKEAERAAKQRISEISRFAEQTASTVVGLGKTLLQDLANDEITAKEAFHNLAMSVLDMTGTIVAETLLTEAIRAVAIKSTTGLQIASSKAVMVQSALETKQVLLQEKAKQVAKGLTAKAGVVSGVAGQTANVAGQVGGGLVGAAGGAVGAAGGAATGAASSTPYGLIALLGITLISGLVAWLTSNSSNEPREATALEAAYMRETRFFSKGGLVTGGTPGRDSVAAMLTPGEYVLNKPTVDAIRRGAPPKTPGHYASGGMVMAAPAGRAQVIFAPQINTLALPDSIQNMRYYRDTVSKTQGRMSSLKSG